MDNNQIMVTVVCLTYNHEKYIRQCLDGFVMQKTNFRFEVIIHDDASTDNTADIIREYEEQYPEIIKPILQKENQYQKGKKILKSVCLKDMKGKYVALCEGDDYWTDKHKLQKQFDAMENNPSCKMCLCKVRAVQENCERMEQTYPNYELPTGLYKTDESLKMICKEYAFQTSSYFLVKVSLKEFYTEEPPFFKVSPVGDWPILLFFSQFDIFYIDEEMSCYRKNVIGNFTTSMNVSSLEKQKKYNMSMIAMIEEYDKYTEYRYHSYCCYFERFHSYYYDLLLQEKNYKEIFSNKVYRNQLKKENTKDRIAIKCYYYFPWLAKKVFDRDKT